MTTIKMVNKWIELFEEGYNITKIARIYNVSPPAVRYHLKKRNVVVKKSRYYGKTDFYKGKYSIALYDLNDNLFCMFDTAREMADFLGDDYNVMQQKITKNCKYRYKNNWYKFKLIEVSQEEIKDKYQIAKSC